VATDTIQSDVPAFDGGEKYAQIFVGTKSLVTDVHGMKSPAQFPGILTEEIITRGAPTKLISDSTRRLVRKFVVYYAHTVFLHGRVNHTSNTRTQLNGDTKQ
jgi:hypothetical protein